ncbi:macrolide ABC transporter ATP-binding protein, partial [Candidatus Magnetomorum sp. HK-1]
YSNISPRNRIKNAINILTNLGLGDRLYHLPGDISGGQRQRVAIARALVNNPKLILADEPTGNLDSITQLEIINLFKEIKEKYNTTIIIVTHDEEVAHFADRIITLFDGKIYADVNITELEQAINTNKEFCLKGVA